MSINKEISQLKVLKSQLEQREDVKKRREVLDKQLWEYEHACLTADYPELPTCNKISEEKAIKNSIERARDYRVRSKKRLFTFLFVLFGVLVFAVALYFSLSPNADFTLYLFIFYFMILCVLPPLILARIFVVKRANRLDEYTASDLDRIRHAEELDKANQAQNERMAVEAEKKLRQHYSLAIEKLEADIAELKRQEKELNAQISQGILRKEDDRCISVVSFLIDRLESGRADTLKEALLQYDEDSRRRWEETKKKLDAYDIQFRQKQEDEHRRYIESLERDRLREAEKARKIIEEMSRR